jgi:transcriptional regulator with XRE-family HTH domain
VERWVEGYSCRRGMQLKLLRVRAGVRQYRVAQELGIPASTLCDWENGRRPLSARAAVRIEQAIERLAPGGIGGGHDAA